MRFRDVMFENYLFYTRLFYRLLGKSLNDFEFKRRVCDIPYWYYLPVSTKFPHGYVGIVISRDAKLGENVVIYQNVTIGKRHSLNGKKVCEPKIGDDTVIYEGSSIIGGVTIGSDCIIGAHSLVLDDFDDGSVVYGVPAVKKFNL